MLCALTFRGHGFWFLAGPDRTPATPASHADQNRRMSKRTRGKPMSPGNDLSEEYVPLCTDLRATNGPVTRLLQAMFTSRRAATSSRHLVLVKTQLGTVYTHQEFKTRSLTPIPFCFGCL